MKKLTTFQQLEIIEKLSCYAGLDTFGKYTPRKWEQAKKCISDIYCIAHLNGTCENPHEDWHEMGFKLLEGLE